MKREREEDAEQDSQSKKRNREIVAAHYNARPNQDRSQRDRSRIIGLRRFNNWVKASLIQMHVPPGSGILDLACGKGGDLNKWNFVQPARWVGVDIAEQSVRQAKERWEGERMSFPAQFYAHDAFGEVLDFNSMKEVGFKKENEADKSVEKEKTAEAEYEVAEKCVDTDEGEKKVETLKKVESSLSEVAKEVDKKTEMQFDVVSCQFAWHYSWESERIANQALKNVSVHLREGGYFFGTIPNARCIRNKLADSLKRSGELSFGNEYYCITFDQIPNEREAFGQRYRFSLDGSLEDCPEFLISPSYFCQMAREYQLECVYLEPFADYYARLKNDRECGALLRRMQVHDYGDRLTLDDAEWEVATLYSVFCFRKRSEK